MDNMIDNMNQTVEPGQDEEIVKKPTVKHNCKDSVFEDLFSDPHYLFQMYKTLHPEDTTSNENDIADVTIRNAMTNDQYNDLGFRIGNRLLVLIEAQSTWTVNIVIRILMYLMTTYNRYFTENKIDLYSSVKVEIPKPELYVVYTGTHKNLPEYLTLQDDFFGGEDISVNARVKVISSSGSDDIINQYIIFTQVLDEQVKIHGREIIAVEETIRICKDRNVLKEYLESREKEVISIMEALYNEQEVMDRYIASREKESEIKATVKAYHRFGRNISEAIEDIIAQFGLSETSAEAKAKQYWA